jgi:copper chaperone CopZ
MPGMDMSGTEKPVTDRTTSIDQSPLQQISFRVSGKCEMCKERIEKAALSVNGVKTASWDIETKMLQVEYVDKVKLLDIHKAVAKAGHDTDMIKADDAVYKALPECCLYREP